MILGQPFDETDEKMSKFIGELNSLSEEYGIYIGGCGCCNSPYLMSDGVVTHHDLEYSEGYGYIAHKDNGYLVVWEGGELEQ